MEYSVTNVPDCYLANFRGFWQVIFKSAPICKEQGTKQDALAAARTMRVTPVAVWNGDLGRFQPL